MDNNKFNAEKTTGVVFSKKKIAPNLQVMLNNTLIRWAPHAKYLGLTFDRKPNWPLYLNQATRKGTAALAQLYSLISQKSRLSTGNKALLFNAII